MDWGSASPFSVGWYAVVQDECLATCASGERVPIPRGALILYREWYGSPNHSNTGLKLTAEQVADGIVARELKEPRFASGKPAISYGVLDPSAFNVVSGPSIAERMFACGVAFRKADNARVGERGALSGWDAVRQRLIGSDGFADAVLLFHLHGYDPHHSHGPA